jgi:hypothetical protein
MSLALSRRGAIGLIAGLVTLAAAARVDAEPVGRVTSAFGLVTIQGDRGPGRVVGGLAAIDNQERIITAPTSAATVLLNSKVVLKLDGATTVRLVEKKGRTEFVLERGKVQVFVGDRGPNLGPVAMVEPESEIITTGTVFFASYAPDTRTGSYSCIEHAMKLSTQGGDSATVQAGQTARVERGRLRPIENLDRNLLRQQVKNIGQLQGRTARRGAAVSRERVAAAAIRSALLAEYAAQGFSLQNALALSDLLQARCADIDHAADLAFDNASQVPLADAKAVNNTVILRVLDLTQLDGDIIQFSARSCTQSNLVTLPDVQLKGDGFVLPVMVDKLPNIVRISVTGISEGSIPQATPTVTVVENGKSRVPVLKKFFLNKGETQYLDIRLPAEGPGQAQPAAVANKSSAAASARASKATRR